MSAIPNLKVPITVQTDQVAPAMKKVEKEVAASASRMSKIRSALTPAMGVAGAGPFGALAGGLGAGGMGGAAVGLAAITLPFASASRVIDSMESEVRGATEALRQFRDTGKLTMAANSVMLERMAALEAGIKPRGSFGQAFGVAVGEGGQGGLGAMSRMWNAAGAGLGTLVGSIFGGGQSINEIFSQMGVQMAENEDEARRAQAQLIFDQMKRREAEAAGTNIGPISGTINVLTDILGAVSELGRRIF